MAQVTYNSIKKFRYYGKDDTIEVKATQEEDSLRDNLIKQILSNQLNKHFELEDCVNFKEKFICFSKQNLSNTHKGLISNKLYKELCEEINIKEVLSSSGLSSNEIDILLHEEEESKLGNITEEAYLLRLKDIEQKLEQREAYLQNTSKEHFSKALKLNRHEYEEECSKSCSERAEKLSCLLKLEPYEDISLPHEHPINNLPDLEKQLFSHTKPESSSFKRKVEQEVKTQIKYYQKKPKTFWDMEERPILVQSSDCKSSEITTCSTPVVASQSFTSTAPTSSSSTTNNLNKVRKKKKRSEKCLAAVVKNNNNNNNNNNTSTDFSRPFVWTMKESELVSIDEIINNRLSVEEIKRNDKFINYSPGFPSQCLYIKNLPMNINPLKVVSLFGNFERENENKLEYRVLKGKMKGQAFVRFKKSEVSKKALAICNGYLMQADKPIVIEYARTFIM